MSFGTDRGSNTFCTAFWADAPKFDGSAADGKPGVDTPPSADWDGTAGAGRGGNALVGGRCTGGGGLN